ncbi:glycoside hydrolase family 2 [Natrinema salsiterrestre]|uniref:Glycoside hydrolase family 2 n=1 Tax=Natrinema salsiterrestre TaxID=2950540 RepID=A0A9Q4KXX2_9EURY|nr:glycoside hydrolase family 2 [Natrinema salsiterrestre]MDF9745658.1 glycoside hydrolase family 2 [Natrinema salsiterrestre]
MTDEWTGGIVTDRGGDGPPTVEEWVSVSGPERPSGFGDEGPIAYRTTVADPRDDETERALLELRGVSGRAEIWLNGTRLGSHDSPVVPARFEFEPRSENELIVVCERPESFAGIDETDAVPDHFETPGVRWGVEVESRPRCFIRRFDVQPRLGTDSESDASADASAASAANAATDGAGAAIDVTLEVDAGAAIDDAVTLSLRPEGFRGGAAMERVPVTAEAGERVTVSKTLSIREPSLWWPRKYGPQDRYTVRAKLGGDSAERTVGLRRVERDEDGLLVNGRRVRARGFTRLPGGDPEADVRRAVDANATLLRARAHVPPRSFYEACDEAGILVWQDLPASGPELPVERGTELAAAIAETYGSHPSLAMYGVQDQPMDPYAEPLGSGLLAKLALRYRAWRTSVDRDPAADIADAIPGDLPVVPVTGPPGTDPDAAQLFPGWRYLAAEDADWLLETYPSLGDVVGGFGAGSLTDDADPATIPGLEPALLERQAGAGGIAPESSQASQADTLKTVAEALRRRGSGIVAASTLRDTASGGGMGIYTIDGDSKPAAAAIARSYEPVQAVLDGRATPGTVGITLCNDTHDALEAIVGWRAGDETDTERVSVGPLETVPAGTARIPRDAETVDLEVAVDDLTVRNRYNL